MARSVDEWVGKTDDTAIPPRVKLRVFEAYKGRCGISGRKITPADKWDCDHIIALVNGGKNRESNLQPAIKAEHKKKTAQDVAQKAKTERIRKKHLGIETKSKGFGGGFNTRFKKRLDGTVVDRRTGEPV